MRFLLVKVLIYILVFFFGTLINNIIGYLVGFRAGALLLYIIDYFIAKKLCQIYDEKKREKDTLPKNKNNLNLDVDKQPDEIVENQTNEFECATKSLSEDAFREKLDSDSNEDVVEINYCDK